MTGMHNSQAQSDSKINIISLQGPIVCLLVMSV